MLMFCFSVPNIVTENTITNKLFYHEYNSKNPTSLHYQKTNK